MAVAMEAATEKTDGVAKSETVEKHLIAALIQDSHYFPEYSDIQPEDLFAWPVHRKIWLAMQQTHIRSGSLGYALVAVTLGEAEASGEHTLVDYLTSIVTTGTYNTGLIPAYVSELQDLAMRRKYDHILAQGQRMAKTSQVVTRQQVEMTINDLVTLLQTQRDESSWQMYDAILDANIIDVERRRQKLIVSCPTGFAEIDNCIGGLEMGTLNYLVGRPSSGKSSLGLDIARYNANRYHIEGQGKLAAYISMEMPAISLAKRMVAASLVHRDAAQPSDKRKPQQILNTRAMRTGFLGPESETSKALELFRVSTEYERLHAGRNLALLDRVVDTKTIRARAAQLVRMGLNLLIIDQLDLCADPRKTNEVDRITGISRALLQIARDLNIAILCCAQLNRDSVKSVDKKPSMEHLAGSDALTRDASIILAVHRPAIFYPPDAQDPDWYIQYAECHVIKNRDGEVGVEVPLRFTPAASTFSNWPAEWDQYIDGPSAPMRTLLENKWRGAA